MSDNFIHLPKRRPKLRRTFKIASIILGSIAAILIVGTVVGSVPPDSNESISSPTLSTNEVSPKNPDTTPKPTPTPTIPSLSQPATAPSANVPSQSEVDASLCNDTIKNAQDMVKSNNNMYFDAWKKWNDMYYGEYDSQAAQDSKRWYKDYFKKLNDDVIRSNDPTMQKFCHSSTSLSSIVVVPNYEAW